MKEYMHPCVLCSIIYNCQGLEVAQVPISKQVDKKAVVHLHHGLLLSQKKEGNFTLCNNVDGTGEYYAMLNKLVREKQIPCNFTYM